MTKTESDAITLSKCLAICLMVLCHTAMPFEWVARFVYVFHMPLFFILSGFCFKEKYLQNSSFFVKRKILGIYVPFVGWSLLILILHNFFFKLHVYDLKYGYAGVGVSIYTSQDYLCKIKEILVSMKTEDDLLGGFWFLKELFWGNVIFFVILKVFNSIKNCKTWIVLLLLSLTVLLRYTMWHIHFVNVNWLSFYAAAFIAIGYAVSGYLSFVMSKKWIIVLLSLIFISAVYFRTENFGVMEQQINTIIPYFVSAVSATLLIYVFFNKVRIPPRVFKYLSFVGQHTLIILILHFLSFKIVSLLIVMCYSLPYNRIAEFPVIFEYASKGYWILYTIVGVIMPLLWVYCFDKVKTFFSEYKYGV